MNTLHCNDCGAPIHIIGQIACEYCGNAFRINPVTPSLSDISKVQAAMSAYDHKAGVGGRMQMAIAQAGIAFLLMKR